jgi:hypothetical protein
VNDEPLAALREGFALCGLNHAELYAAYRALGGTGTESEIAGFLDGVPPLGATDFNLLAQAINERLRGANRNDVLAYAETEADRISYFSVASLLASATPTFEVSVDAARADLRDGNYVFMTGFARHLIGLLASEETAGFHSIFETVERILATGDDLARQLMSYGFFYELLTTSAYERTGRQPADFAPWLGPRARGIPAVAELLDGR